VLLLGAALITMWQAVAAQLCSVSSTPTELKNCMQSMSVICQQQACSLQVQAHVVLQASGDTEHV
jgi:hypothetical protein